MIELLVSLVHFCASCVSDNNVIPPALGALGGAAGAAGGLGGLGGLGGNAGTGASPGDGADGGSGADAPSGNRPQPIGDTPPANGPQPIGDQGAAPDRPDGWGTGKNPDGGHTITYGGTRTTFEPGGGPVPIDDNLPGNVSDPQPIGDTPPAHGPQPIGDTPPANGPQPIGNAPSTTADASPNDQPPSGDTQPTGDSTPVPDTQPSDASPATDNPQSPNAPTTIRTPDGTVTTIQPDGSTNVESTLPPSGGGLTTGPGATDPNDPQQGQQPIGFTHQVLGPMSPSDPTSSISDMPNTAHIQGTAAPGATPVEPGTSPTGSTSAGSTAHKPHTP